MNGEDPPPVNFPKIWVQRPVRNRPQIQDQDQRRSRFREIMGSLDEDYRLPYPPAAWRPWSIGQIEFPDIMIWIVTCNQFSNRFLAMTSALYVYVSESVARVLTRDASPSLRPFLSLRQLQWDIVGLRRSLSPEMILVKYVVLRSAYDYHVESGTDIGASEEEIFGRDVRGPVLMFWEGPGLHRSWTSPGLDPEGLSGPQGYVDYVDPAMIPAAEPQTQWWSIFLPSGDELIADLGHIGLMATHIPSMDLLGVPPSFWCLA